MEKRALGRGLKALIPEIEQEQSLDRVVYIKISDVQPNRYQPREDFDLKGIEELASSIKEKGLLQPIVVRKANGSGYELIAGERRLRAIKSLGIDRIPAIIKEAEFTDSFILSLLENIQRKDLNPMEEAKAYRRLLDEFEFTQEAVAEAVKKDRASVANYLRLLKLPSNIQHALAAGKITMGHAKVILSQEDEARQLQLFKKIIESGLSVRDTEAIAKRQRGKKLHITKDPHLISMEEGLQHIFGTKVRIIHTKRRGKIIIEYYSSEDLDRVYSLLKISKPM